MPRTYTALTVSVDCGPGSSHRRQGRGLRPDPSGYPLEAGLCRRSLTARAVFYEWIAPLADFFRLEEFESHDATGRT